MDIIKVKSSMIEAIAYNSRRENLTVKFKNGGFYRYSDVPADVAEELQNVKSAGNFFSSEIKPFYNGEKVNGSKMEKQMAEEVAAPAKKAATTAITPTRKAALIKAGAWPFPV